MVRSYPRSALPFLTKNSIDITYSMTWSRMVAGEICMISGTFTAAAYSALKQLHETGDLPFSLP
jgi:hypothetical protein